ncbi:MULTISPECIES: hypothetical protein [Pseudomonas]|uniref:PD-(D/E)XK nuclease superfamily protein n=1 Tax=Pseudomonas flexibilis TaxID=706570 RepID=A0A1N6Q218_9PSED|nr:MULTISPECIES: hypothetical protein [Pseudomonas]KHL69318.1 hypothetical protein SF06_20500 [Pseudomonas flexibilis]SIQ10583.1 hypothetical protein SAMN05421672_10331 [Pseudomonas flexibilis]
MNTSNWIGLFNRAFKAMDYRLEQVLQLQSCREHWIQAELSLYAYFYDNLEIWTDADIGNGKKADLYAVDEQGRNTMVAEIKCLGDYSQSKCLEGDWSIRNDIERLQQVDCSTRLFILVIPHLDEGHAETRVGARLRAENWAGQEGQAVDVALSSASVRIWAV